MDSKTKHRLLGILVVIAVGVILFPFFQSNKEFTKETAVVNAPPFPDQSVQVSSNPTPTPQAIDTASTDEMTEQSIPLPPNDQLVANDLQPLPDEAVTPPQAAPSHEPDLVKQQDEPVPLVEPKKDIHHIESPKIRTVEKEVAADKIVASNAIHKAVRHHKTIHVTAKMRKTPIPATPLDDDGLIKLKDAAWVIQIGSFNKKENALRLVNQLRANGYRAFIQQISTRLGNSTRVFVGPETQRDAAFSLASEIEKDMNLHGVVISYKPLSL